MGGTLGGPIKQNRMFFFGAFQYARNRQRPSDSQTFVPTQAMLNGDFTQIASAACNNGTALNLPAPFVNNQVESRALQPDRDAHRRAAAGRRPIRADAATYAVPDNNDEQQIVGRVDWQATDDQRIFGRYYIANYDRAAGYEGTQPAAVARAAASASTTACRRSRSATTTC